MPKKRFETSPNDSYDNNKELGNKKKFTRHDLIGFDPRNPRQDQFKKLYDSGKEIIAVDGPAGTGKTFVALYLAASEVFSESSSPNKIVIVRSAVETRPQGFLPGDPDEKNQPFEVPYKSIFDEIIKYKDNYNNLKALGYYDFITTTHIRGVTLHDSVIIVDECQNLDYSELLSVLTRAGDNSRIIMIGDKRQDDLKRQRQVSGFEKMKNVLKLGMPYGDLGEVMFKIEDSTARSALVGKIVSADYYYGDKE